ncbi:MAG: 50S ribosomal protein L9 [Helicobacteraceae bacterium]
MKVLLLKDVKSLGRAGEIKDVKDGYGQNFIIAKGYGKLATPAVIKQYEAEQRKLKEAKEQEAQDLRALAAKISKASVTITKKLGANGSLFGAIKKEEIADELAKQGIVIDKKDIDLSAQIKATGEYEAKVKLKYSISATLKVSVQGE